MERLKKGWKRTPSAIRKPLVFIIGALVIIIGIILLPLPGPGWVIIFLGFAILATEFTHAQRVRDWLYGTAMAIWKWCKDNAWKPKPKK